MVCWKTCIWTGTEKEKVLYLCSPTVWITEKNCIHDNVLLLTKQAYILRWQTFIGAVLLLLSGKLGWVEMSRINRYFCLFLDDCQIHVQLHCKEFCLNVLFQISCCFLASRLPPICGKHICWFQGFITHSNVNYIIHSILSTIMDCCLALHSYVFASMGWFFTGYD